MKAIEEIDQQIEEGRKRFLKQMKQLVASTEEGDRELKEACKILKNVISKNYKKEMQAQLEFEL